MKTQFGYYVFEVDQGQGGVPAVARRGQGDHPQPAQVPAPAEGPRRVHQELPRGLQGQDRLRRGLPHRRVQERPEGEDRHRSGLGRRARRPAGTAAARADSAAAAGTAGAVVAVARPRRRSSGWTRSRGGSAANAPGTASRTSARSFRTPSRRPTSSRMPPTGGDDAKLLDELGDVLFQVEFLALLLEERGAGSLAEVADHCREKLIRRHPHVFGETEARNGRGGPPQLEPDQARGRARRRDLRRHPGDAAVHPVRQEGPQARRERRASSRPAGRGRRRRAPARRRPRGRGRGSRPGAGVARGGRPVPGPGGGG